MIDALHVAEQFAKDASTNLGRIIEQLPIAHPMDCALQVVEAQAACSLAWSQLALARQAAGKAAVIR